MFEVRLEGKKVQSVVNEKTGEISYIVEQYEPCKISLCNLLESVAEVGLFMRYSYNTEVKIGTWRLNPNKEIKLDHYTLKLSEDSFTQVPIWFYKYCEVKAVWKATNLDSFPSNKFIPDDLVVDKYITYFPVYVIDELNTNDQEDYEADTCLPIFN